jgi:lipopolysaccharide transport protein LptA
VLLAILLFSGASVSAGSKLPIDLQSDQFHIDMDRGTHILSGNASLIQGGLSIHADQIKVKPVSGAISSLSASGSPLLLENISVASLPMRAHANSIQYETRKWTLILTGNVKLMTPSWEAKSDSAKYNLRKQLITLVGNKINRVKILFYNIKIASEKK